MPDQAALAKRIIDSNLYMTLATADGEGRPWASPVWFAHERYSTLPMGNGQAVYLEAEVEQLEGDSTERAIAVFSSRSRECGGREWTAADVRPPARLRLYLATASAQFVLGPNDERIAVSLA